MTKPKKPPVPTCRMCLRARDAYAKVARDPAKVKAYKTFPAACHTCHCCEGIHGCHCVDCRSCAVRVPRWSICKHCRSCRSCCYCRKTPHWVAPDQLNVFGTSTHYITLPRCLGVELELANWGTIEKRRFRSLSYRKDFDSSVVPSQHEMVVSPFYGDGALAGIVELAYACHVDRVSVNNTCGYHVHVDGADLSYWELRRLMTVYERLEKEIYDHLVAPHRRDDPATVHYCQLLTRPHERCEKCVRFDQQHPGARFRPETLRRTLVRMWQAKSTGDLKYALFKMLYSLEDLSDAARAGTLDTRKGGKYEWIRYFGLNLHSWMYRKTIEFRMKEATTDLEELLFWPLWCGWMVHATQCMTDADARDTGLTLAPFTRKFMPVYLAEWVERKVKQ